MRRFLAEARWLRTTSEILGFLGWALTTSYVLHHLSWVAAVGIGIFVGFNVIRIIIDRARETNPVDPKESAVREMLRFLAVTLFGDKPGYRVTVLIPNEKNEYIHPVYRYQLGGPSGRCFSEAKFPKGVALSGFAWREPRTPFKKNKIGPFASDDEYVKYYTQEFKMSKDLVMSLSSHMKQVQSIFCIGLVDHRNDFLAVLSMDSIDPEGFDKIPQGQLKKFVAALGATLD